MTIESTTGSSVEPSTKTTAGAPSYKLAPREEGGIEVDAELATTTEPQSTETLSTSDGSSHVKKEEDSKAESAPPSLTKILNVARPEWPALFLAVVLMVGSEGIGLINPIVIARAYDALVDESLDEGERMSEIHQAMALVMILHFSGVAAGFLRHTILAVIGERLVARLRNFLYASILKQEIAFFDEHKSGELISRLSSDTSLLQTATSMSLPEFVLGMIKLIVSISLMFWISYKLAAMTIGGVLLIFMVAVPFGTVLGKLSKSYQDELGEAQTRSTESLGAMRTVQSFAAEVREQDRYKEKIGDPDEFPFWWPRRKHEEYHTTKMDGNSKTTSNKTTYSVGFFKAIWNSAFFTFIFGFGFASMYASLWYGFKLVNDGEISLGDLTAFQSYIFQVGFGLAGTSNHLSKVLEALGASGRIFFLVDRIPLIPTPPSEARADNDTASTNKAPIRPPPSVTLKPEKMEGLITVENVSFSYPSRPGVAVLKNFNLRLEPNTTAALVGSSGAGKSTIVSLLQRFYDVNEGSIKIDGNDIRDLDLTWLRTHIGYVQQEPTLFGLTVKENICYGVIDRDVTQEEIESVCRKANAHEFIMEFPTGYDTLVGERGVKLSGGQKQRICLARALISNPSILLLDEATSALDAESEHLVQEAIEKAVVGRTVLIVAHRLSTIQRATQIVVMDNHEMVDVGSHDELLRRCSKYQDLIKRQSVVQKGAGKGLNGIDWSDVIGEADGEEE